MEHESQVLRKNLPAQMALDGFDANFGKTLNNLAQIMKGVSVGNCFFNLFMS
jgi:hypothetical protein